MHVLHLLDTMQLAGTEMHVLDLCRASRTLGVNTTIACRLGGGLHAAALDAGLDTLPVDKGFLHPVGFAQVRQFARVTPDCILHAHNGRTGLVAALCARAQGTPVVKTQHFLSPAWVNRSWSSRVVSRPFHRWADRQICAHIAVSIAVQQQMLRRGEADAARTTVVWNGITASGVQASPASAPSPRPFAIHGAGPVVFCAARLEPEKDVETLVRAMGRIATRDLGVTCAVAGEGSLRGELDQLVVELGLEEQFRFLGFRPDVQSLLQHADVFVLPSPAEPFGLVLLEAMAVGRAVVAVRAGGPVEIVEHGVTGLLVPPGDAKAMGDAINSLLADPERRAAMGAAGQRRFEAYFTAERMARATLEVYRRVLDERAASVPSQRGAVASAGGSRR